MKKLTFLLALITFYQIKSSAQTTFDYNVHLNPVNVSGLPGIHSYAFAQHNGKWLIIGGRLDGLHARQPFNSFPENQNNADIYVIDVNANQFWSASLYVLPTGIKEQLQSTNMNFYQDEDTLYIIGGYAYSQTAVDHITFPNLTSIDVPGLITAITTSSSITPYFKQITDQNFALTGAQLGKIGDTFYLVGGHRFDGRYNPMGNPTYTQTYANSIRKFKLNNSGSQLSYSNYTTITDPVHLRRRDYNLMPQIFPDGSEGYMISAGVFQASIDLPFLYPVNITDTGYQPITGFNQYLSQYHSAKAALYDSVRNEMHNLFFGGMSQYYYENGTLTQNDSVPFVKTISRVSRDSSGNLEEIKFNDEMPALKGASAEFIPNHTLPQYKSDVIKLGAITTDSILIGHIFGGIYSPTRNPFANNLTTTTSADTNLYEIWLIKSYTTIQEKIDGSNPFSLTVSPNPTKNDVIASFVLPQSGDLHLMITDNAGKLIKKEILGEYPKGNNTLELDFSDYQKGVYHVTMIFDGKYYQTKQIIKQ